MTTIAQPVTGQDINLAAQATRKALDVVLAEQGTSFAPVATLNNISARGKSLDRDGLVLNLAGAFQIDEQSVLTILHGLEARGLVRQALDDVHGTLYFELTAEGEAEQRRLSGIISGLTAELYRDFHADELATTRRVLVTLTERAAAHVASSVG
jgi:DNA-binding MarR family transcriptional regulator